MRDQLATPATLHTKAKKVRREFIKTGEEQGTIALRHLEADKSLEGTPRWMMIAMARGVAMTASMVATAEARKTATAVRTERGPRDQRDVRMAMMQITFTVGGKPFEFFVAPLTAHKAYVEEQRNEAAGANSRADFWEREVIKRLENAHVNTVRQLGKEQWYELADGLADLKKGGTWAA